MGLSETGLGIRPSSSRPFFGVKRKLVGVEYETYVPGLNLIFEKFDRKVKTGYIPLGLEDGVTLILNGSDQPKVNIGGDGVVRIDPITRALVGTRYTGLRPEICLNSFRLVRPTNGNDGFDMRQLRELWIYDVYAHTPTEQALVLAGVFATDVTLFGKTLRLPI